MASTQRTMLSSLDTFTMVPVCRKSWADYLSSYTSKYEEEVGEMKELVRKSILESMEEKPMREQLNLVDSIQRLGLANHFEEDIEATLCRFYDTHRHFHANHLDLYHAALLFRLLRRHGFNISSDVFKQFVDGNGKFKESVSDDLDGMLSLYEASHLRTHEDDILDEAFYFTKDKLQTIMDNSNDEQVVDKVSHALKYPIHKIVARLDTRFYISQYHHNPLHCKTLLDFAKLDFNLLQALHKKELEYIARWCDGWDVASQIPYKVRDVIVSIYFCALGAMDEHPQRSFVRIIWFKLCWLCTIMDDLYDILDIPDLELLTTAIQRWDKKSADQLPSVAQITCTLMLQIFEDVKHDMVEIGRSNFPNYIVDVWKQFWSAHLKTSKWSREEFIPSLEEYLSEGSIAVGSKAFPIISFALEETATQEVLEWAMQYPKAMEAFGKITRIEDDIADDDLIQETATQKPSAVACYMKEYKMRNKKQVYEELQKMSNNYWKDINEAMVGSTSDVPKRMVEIILKQTHYLCLLSPEGDGYTNPSTTFMKKNYELLFKDCV